MTSEQLRALTEALNKGTPNERRQPKETPANEAGKENLVSDVSVPETKPVVQQVLGPDEQTPLAPIDNALIEQVPDNEMLRAAKDYHRQGRCLVLVRGKAMDGPLTKALIKPGQERIHLGYPAGRNIGIWLGKPSGGLVDVDLDWELAATIAYHVGGLQGAPASGRKGKPLSHRWVLSDDAGRRVTFDLPPSLATDPRLPRDHTMMVAELRGDGCMTVVPPSTHPSGEQIVWQHLSLEQVPKVSWDMLQRRVGIVALLAVCAKLYPAEGGGRHHFSMALAGTLLDYYSKDEESSKWTEPELVAWVDRVVEYVARLDHEKSKPWKPVAAATLARIKEGKPTWKLKRLCQLLGNDDLLPRFKMWLGQECEERPLIYYRPGDIPQAIDEVQTAMLAGDAPLYQRSGYLARPLRLEKSIDKEGIKREAGTLIIERLSSYGLLAMIEQHAVLLKLNGKTKKWQRTDPPQEFRGAFLAAKDLWRMPPLNGIADSPIMRADGSVCQTEGYDEASGMLLDFAGLTYPAIPEHPTGAEAHDALSKLDEVIKGFPFDGNTSDSKKCGLKKCASRSVALSMLLSPHVAQTIDAVPLHLAVAPEARSGKTLLVECAGIIATGAKPPAMSYTGREEEDEKRFVGAYMAGGPLLLLDNIRKGSSISGDFLCQAITGATAYCRLLGSTGQITVPTRMMVAASGNNVGTEGDLAFRSIACTIDAAMENPGERTFDVDLHSFCKEHRAKLVAACLTILRYADGAEQPSPFGGFEQWNRIVRAALLRLGEVDPLDTAKGLHEENPETATLAMLAAAWAAHPDLGIEKWCECKAVMDAFHMDGDFDLAVALRQIFTPPRVVTAEGLGRYLSGLRQKVVKLDGADHRFERQSNPKTRRSEYKLSRVDPQGHFGHLKG